MVHIEILGGGNEVGRAAYLIVDDNKKFLLDYGVNFDEEDHPQFPLHVRPIELSGLAITHAHLDHIGAAPLLYITGKPRVFVTKPTLDIGKLLISDFLKLNAYYIDYSIEEFEAMASNAYLLEYGVEVENDGFKIIATNAGHILGSAMIYLETPSGHRILYTGDVNTIQTWTLSRAELWPLKIDTLIIESTYGSTKHPPRHYSEKRLVDAIEEVTNAGGTVLIPAFSVGRSQEVMCLVQAELPHLDVYLDGMSREITNIYLKHKRFLRDPSLFEKAVQNTFFIRGWHDRRKAWKKPGVIISSAGMLKGGPSVYYLKKIAKEPKNAVFLVSYQAPNTPGHVLLEKGIYEEFGLDEPIKARLEWFDLSSHAGKDGLISIIQRYKNTLKNLIIIHGEPDSASNLASMAVELLGNDVNIVVPLNGDKIELES
ncbi:MBL fold metallo-hydrolase [Staphylothermus hellenicus]|uniref:Beta-lactamase domain protein n=1 Tax=Staphylothermus hellenicus (strain DSM 12710 / JCM 10830 / BK20S6-10-b1 / P8) TaxID=591019 RepID=D7DA90_STAHD|nr:MBL fold metallo-hydrolase [Staphylothermus hellenicus]ADI32686.1 beta-lactamase domain protein [Staphylothermus hellenicus DSM 12710]